MSKVEKTNSTHGKDAVSEHNKKNLHTTANHAEEKNAFHDENKEVLMDEGLQAIYGDEKINFERLERHGNNVTRILSIVVVVLSILAATSWAGFFVYTKFFEPTKDESFKMEIMMPSEIISGQTAQIEINYSNPTNVPIASLSLDVNLPSTFISKTFSQEPSNADELVWDMGSLGGRSDGKITIDGIWIAQAPSQTPVQVRATYKPGNFNSDFEDIEVVYITTLSSTVSAKIEGPEQASSGETLEYTITIENTGEEAIENLEANIELPDGFYLQESDPALEAGGPSVWTIEKIEPKTTRTIRFTGTFASDSKDFQYFNLSIGIISDEKTLEQVSAQTYTDVQSNDVMVQLVANGSTSNTALDLGDELKMSIGLENTKLEPIENVKVLLDFQSDDSIPITWSQSDLDFGTLTKDGIVWSFDTIEPGEKILLNTNFPIDDALGVGDADSFQVVASASYDGRSAYANPMQVMINSQATISASARYYADDGSIIGSGTMPPKVGQTTSLVIFINLENSLHDLSNVQISTQLAPDITWLGNEEQTSGSISYNNSSGTINWLISSMPATDGHVQASFTVSFVPQSDDVGSFVKLTSSLELTATDSATGSTITREIDAITTDFTDDVYGSAAGGAVVE